MGKTWFKNLEKMLEVEEKIATEKNCDDRYKTFYKRTNFMYIRT